MRLGTCAVPGSLEEGFTDETEWDEEWLVEVSHGVKIAGHCNLKHPFKSDIYEKDISIVLRIPVRTVSYSCSRRNIQNMF